MSNTSKNMHASPILLVNFGGPRNIEEVQPFLISLLNDQELIRTSFPAFFHRLIFTPIAKKRAKKVKEDYASIGGKSPIFEDTEAIAQILREKFKRPILTYHRYLSETHPRFLQNLQQYKGHQITVFPFFAQFSYATTGSIATWLSKHIPKSFHQQMVWVKSYAAHEAYIACCQKLIKEYMHSKGLKEEEVFLLFSAHGLPVKFIQTGDPYQNECEQSYQGIMKGFPKMDSLLAYQSQFGKDPWIRPYTKEVCESIESYTKLRHVVMFPLSFTSDHIETLFEIEQLYLPVIKQKKIQAWRCPALNLRQDWLDAICEIISSQHQCCDTEMLLRR